MSGGPEVSCVICAHRNVCAYKDRYKQFVVQLDAVVCDYEDLARAFHSCNHFLTDEAKPRQTYNNAIYLQEYDD